ncbi:MAG TPA: TetR/AcrR family transcriptional regulator [Gemmatimonadaceae bacterium]|nr:TetR/AcrR family transcriptional regulator [Gemmatimonadaceae bacterium]
MSALQPVGAPAALQRRLARASTQRKLDRLLTKAAALIAEKGFEATTMRDLGTAMEVSLAGLYHYFASKEDLLFQLQYRTFASLNAGQEQIAAEPGTPEERFRRLLIGHLRFYHRHTKALKACTFELESLKGERYRAIEELRREYYRLMTAVVSAVTDGGSHDGAESRRSRHATLFVFGMLNWIFMWYHPDRHGPVEQIGEEMYDLVVNGLRREQQGR